MPSVSAQELSRIMASALLRRDVPRLHADYVVDALIAASLRGIDTHGIHLFPTYLDEIDGGRSQAQPNFSWKSRGRASAVLDAGDALGIVAGRVAAAEAVRIALEFDVGAVAVARSNHFGAASTYSMAMAEHDMVGISLSNSDALVAAHQGLRALFGTNPLSLAAPGADGEVFCVDMATSQVSYCRVKAHREHGLALPPGWIVDQQRGSDATAAVLKPLGGHKGQCLSMLVEILCALLSNMPFDHELSHFFSRPFDRPRRVSHFLLALRIEAFQDLSTFKSRLSQLLAAVRIQDAAVGHRVIAPGDLEQATAASRERDGIPVPDDLYRRFRAIEAEVRE